MRAIRLLVFSLLYCLAAPAFAQDMPVKLSGRLDPADVRAGEMTRAVVEMQLEEGWHVYSLTKREGPGPRPTRVSLLENQALTATGEAVQPVPHKELDKGFNIEVEYFSHAVALSVPVKVNPGISGPQKATLEIQYQVCKDGACLRPTTEEVPIEFTVEPGEARADRLAALTSAATQPPGYQPPTEGGSSTTPAAPSAGTTSTGAPVGDDITARIAEARGQGLLAYLLLAVTMGFLALLTPCVFPMVPITVSYFTKQQETNPGSGLKGALAYCLGIVGTFTGLGLLMSVVFKSAGAVSDLATNPWINIGLAVLFTVMAFNLFGAFEIIMPSWIVERTSSGSQKGGYVGPILMGLTFSLTSFTCTFGFVGALLATAAGGGSLLWPALGMIAFSAAFASPFFLLALFPGWLAKLPKAGAWMVTVKGYMGFLELAAALKFLSNADLVWQWGFITRPVFLAVWFALFAMAGCYLLGWLALPHSGGGQIGLFRRGLGVATLALGVVMLAAMNGMPLGQAAGFLPPRVYPGQTETVAEGGIHWSEDYDAAVKQAKAEGKPLFLDFTGVTCTNCRVMEDTIFPRPEVAAELKKFVTVRLYTDKEDAQSQRYAEMQAKRFKQTTLPLYVILSPDEKEVGQAPYTPNAPQFVSFLQSGQSQAQQVAENR